MRQLTPFQQRMVEEPELTSALSKFFLAMILDTTEKHIKKNIGDKLENNSNFEFEVRMKAARDTRNRNNRDIYYQNRRNNHTTHAQRVYASRVMFAKNPENPEIFARRPRELQLSTSSSASSISVASSSSSSLSAAPQPQNLNQIQSHNTQHQVAQFPTRLEASQPLMHPAMYSPQNYDVRLTYCPIHGLPTFTDHDANRRRISRSRYKHKCLVCQQKLRYQDGIVNLDVLSLKKFNLITQVFFRENYTRNYLQQQRNRVERCRPRQPKASSSEEAPSSESRDSGEQSSSQR